MNPDQQQAILTLALLAAFADGANDDREREQIRQLAETLGGEAGANELPRIYQQVLLKKVKPERQRRNSRRTRAPATGLRNGSLRLRCRRPHDRGRTEISVGAGRCAKT